MRSPATALAPSLAEVHAVLRDVALAGRLGRAERGARSERIAAALLTASRSRSFAHERAQRTMLARLCNDAQGQALTTALTDRVFRSGDPRRVVAQLALLCERFGIPSYLPSLARMQLWAARAFGPLLPALTGRAILERVRGEARHMLLSSDPGALKAFVDRRAREGVQVNLNQLGEALLGEREALARVDKYVALARSGSCDALSVKVSSIGSQLSLLSFEDTVATLATRLAQIYEASLCPPDARRPVVMLDMEAYNDVALTLAVMRRALRDETLREVRAGVVLQAYLPDSNALLGEVAELSATRVREGAQGLRLRIVKGANLAHERVESAKSGHALPIFAEKREVDANFKRLVERATPHVARGELDLGVASHNLFDLAYALVLRSEHGAERGMGIEMLEGMANDTVRVLRALKVAVMVYAPICGDDAMSSGIAYLVRRLDENTAPENFLRASFGMQPGDAAFEQERVRFREALEAMDSLDETPRREREQPRVHGERFTNEPDTDFARVAPRVAIRAELLSALAQAPPTLVSRVAGADCPVRALRAGSDPSRPGAVPYHVALANEADVERALSCVSADHSGWTARPPEERVDVLAQVATRLRAERRRLTAALVLDGGKRVVEADAEISEAIDFAEYYRRSYRAWLAHDGLELPPRGAVLVTPPWNFPLAIAAGGVLAALVTGNRVILKPPLETALVGTLLSQLLWEAGVPEQALQLVLCEDDVASRLVEDARIDAVILTGATDTARLFQQLRPGLHLLAETGGKNAYVVTAMSDRELAIRDVVQSAFGHAGQKCSACSLLVLAAEVHDDPSFMDTLKDAVESLRAGSAWDERSFVTPLIAPPSGPLLRALSESAPGEHWLVAPKMDVHNSRLVSPGVKLGVAPNSFMHTTELFGPVLSVMRAESLEEAIDLANATGYALTAGLASLDEREQALFLAKIRAGNIYVNRTITGAIVQRQPFGGFGKSGFGPGAKAGGPNYVAQLCRPQARQRPGEAGANLLASPTAARLLARLRPQLPAEQAERLDHYVIDYARAERTHFAQTHDFAKVLGQDNLFCYRPAEEVVLRLEQDAEPLDVAASVIAAQLVGCTLDVSVSPGFEGLQTSKRWGHAVCVDTIAQLEARVSKATRVRLLGTRSRALELLAAQWGAHIADAPVLPHGALELLHYVREQAVSFDYHRYGNLGARAQRA